MLYRLGQLRSALWARLSEADRALLDRQLSAAERRLFERMAPFDQRHALDVYQLLVHAGEQNTVLLQAALLHDCGKVDDQGRTIPLLYYGLFVILKKYVPGLYKAAAQHGRGLLWPFAIHQSHEQRSIQLIAQAGSSAELLALLQDYAAGRQTPATIALAWADDLC